MKLFTVMTLVCALAWAGQSSGDISGRVRVTSKLTRKRVSVPQVYERAAAIVAPLPASADQRQEVARVVIYLEGLGLAAHPTTATMDQTHRRFEPELVAVPAGSSVSFPNSDPIFHNVFSLSKPKSFDLGNYPLGESRMVTFPHAGVVQVHCHLHPNMSGAVVVTPNDWFTQPSEGGRFQLPPVPPGRYTVVAWHKSAGFFRRTVDVQDGKAVTLDFEIPVSEEQAP